MTDDGQDTTEPQTILVQTVHVRHGDAAGPLAETIVAFLNAGEPLIDLSRHDRRSDVVELRTTQIRSLPCP